MVEKGGGRGESDSRLLSITGRKDKNLLSLCQHSMAQRDFIDQRTAMQEPLLHPSDTIYHAPPFPPSFPMFFSPHRHSMHPIMQKRQKKKTSLKKNLAHSRANDWGLKAKPATFQQDTTNGLTPHSSKGNKLRFGTATWISTEAKRIFLPLLTISAAITGTFCKSRFFTLQLRSNLTYFNDSVTD